MLQGILDDRFVCTFNAGKPLDKATFIALVTSNENKDTRVLSERTIVVVQGTAVVVETDIARAPLRSGFQALRA